MDYSPVMAYQYYCTTDIMQKCTHSSSSSCYCCCFAVLLFGWNRKIEPAALYINMYMYEPGVDIIVRNCLCNCHTSGSSFIVCYCLIRNPPLLSLSLCVVIQNFPTNPIYNFTESPPIDRNTLELFITINRIEH